jgi:hypothetical protein
LGVTPDNVTEYRFVAYSYFDETGTPPTDGAGIDPVHDLVYGMSVNTKIEDETEAALTLTIHMTHKFARVKVRIKSSITGANISYLSGIAIDGGQTAGLNLFTGNITWSGSVNQDMGLSGNYSAGEVASEYRTVKPVASPTRVRIGSVRVNTSNTTFSGTVDIGLALNGATSYNLLVDLKKATLFAYSNIVWNGSKLTFATTPAENATIPADAQGVFFQWGSLVATSPVGSSYTAAQYPTGSVLFSPTSLDDYSWGNLPYIDETSAPFNNNVTTEDDFATYNSNTGFNTATKKGDICRYITSMGWVSGSWRMPKNSEFDALVAERTPVAYGSWAYISNAPSGSNAYGNYAYGYYRIGSGKQMGTDLSLNFPATGERYYSSCYGTGTYGCLWSGSSRSASAGIYLAFVNGGTKEMTDSDRQYGMPIRCIRIN